MVEMMLAVSLTALIVGTVTAVYAYSIQRLGYGLADASTQQQAEYGLDVIDKTVNLAQTCVAVSVSSTQCLKCTMPSNCTDTNGDGILDSCSPSAINRRSLERWGNGYRVWFYLSDSSGTPGHSGSILWMARRTDDSTPTSSNVVTSYTYFPGNSVLRQSLAPSVTASPSVTSNSYYESVGATANGNNTNGAIITFPAVSNYQFILTRMTYMRGWRY